MAVIVSKEELVEVLKQAGLLEEKIVLMALDQVLRSQGSQRADDESLQIEQHVFPVTLEVIRFLRDRNMLDPEIVATALLHDVLEDDKSIDENHFREMFARALFRMEL